MADQKISALNEHGATPSSNDLFPIIIKSDTSQSAGGSTKKITMENFANFLGSNFLINANPGAIMQRQNPTVTSGRSDDAYAADRWYVVTQSAAVDNVRISGDNQRYAWRIVQNAAAAQRYGFAQIVEGINCHHLKEETITFAGRIRSSSGITVHANILEWTGTEDTVTSDFVNDWLSVNYTTGNFFISSNYRVPNTGTDLTLTSGQWISFSTTGIMSSGLHNVVVGLWTLSGNKDLNLDVEALQLVKGGNSLNFVERPFPLEVMLCQGYYTKTFPLDTAPADGNGGGTVITNSADATTVWMNFPTWQFSVTMRATPTITLYNPEVPNANKGRNVSAGTNVPVILYSPAGVGDLVSQHSVSLTVNNTSVTNTHFVYVAATADAEL